MQGLVTAGFAERARLAASVICAALVPLALWGWMAVQTRADALQAAMADQRRVVDALGEHALRLLETQALLIDIVDRVAGGRDCATLRADAQFQDLLRLSAADSTTGTLLWVVNADGRICMASDPRYVDDRDRSFREYFTGARDAPGQHYVARAIMGISPPVPTFNISRARWRNGAFNGVIVTAPSLGNLLEYWNKALDPARTQRITLFRTDGATIARSWPPLVPPADAAVEHRVAAIFSTAQGAHHGHSVVDGRPRVGAWRTLPDWNVVVSSSENEIEVLAPWRQETTIYGALAGLVALLLGALSWMLLRGRQALERTVAERTHALRRSEARLKLATAGAGVGTWELDLFSGQGLWSPESAALLGMRRESFTAADWLEDAVHPDDRAEVAACWQRALDDGAPYDMEFRPAPPLAPTAAGQPRWLAARGRIERGGDGRPLRAAGILIDVTARRRVETALAESRARLEAALASMTDAVLIQGAGGGFTLVNDAFAGYHRFADRQEALRRLDEYPALFELVTEAGAPVPCEQWPVARALRGETAVALVARLRRRDSDETWFGSYSFAPIRDGDGPILGAVVTARDITRQRAAEAALHDLNRRLEERVRAEVAAREEAQERATHAQRLQALGQLAGGIAHDFNNILQAVETGTTLIVNRAADPASVRRFAATVLRATARGGAITRRLLAFARRDELRAERIDLPGLLEGLRDVLAQTLGSPITVRIALEEPVLPAVMADRGQLETVLVNLATNARDAMPGGGTLVFAATTELVAAGGPHRAGLQPGRYVRLAVTDSGTGMDRATLARAMEPFFTTKPQDQGTGLGLSMARGFAEQSGGSLAIDSAPGQGTTVTLWLPLAGAQREAPAPRPGVAPVAGLARRLLLVDDEEMVRETLAATLEDAGFVVLGAGSGQEALALLEAGEAVDMIISDISMPGLDGPALIRAAQQRRPGLPGILLTGFAGEASQLIAGEGSGVSLLRKPVGLAGLLDAIEAALGARAGA
ncbi:Histidine kinase [Rhodovastum atsumiense]|uniref:histidine kinase n=1 Tax=Rhodovastum atsumiense TaxID=504468 RepID=A0A5M6IXJ6_9PROT|nr:ATP-binding protein [Rhodovastum atsumiense]KAA5612689.1 response regulator [Rhodovastum atsumiense]CAH2602762.1 Histidine kinase [Rhodovastum atsumiense]